MANSILVIHPYKDSSGVWMFDDEATGLRREPFILGIDKMLDLATSSIEGAEGGFNLFFSACPFPNHTLKLEWRRQESGGNWYFCPQYGFEGWLCPALFKYFSQAPPELYAKPEPKE